MRNKKMGIADKFLEKTLDGIKPGEFKEELKNVDSSLKILNKLLKDLNKNIKELSRNLKVLKK